MRRLSLVLPAWNRIINHECGIRVPELHATALQPIYAQAPYIEYLGLKLFCGALADRFFLYQKCTALITHDRLISGDSRRPMPGVKPEDYL